VDEEVEVLTQVQAEAAATWRSPGDGQPTVPGVEPGSSAASCHSTFSSLPYLMRASRSNRPGLEFVSLVNEAIAH
jgi:hypothetical protein